MWYQVVFKPAVMIREQPDEKVLWVSGQKWKGVNQSSDLWVLFLKMLFRTERHKWKRSWFIFPWYTGIPIASIRDTISLNTLTTCRLPHLTRWLVWRAQAKMVGRKKVGFIPAQSSYRVTDGCVLVLFLVCISGIYYCKQLLGASYSLFLIFKLGDMINLGWLNIGKPENLPAINLPFEL